MAPVQQYLITARFVTTMGHFIALLLLFSTIQNNINASLGDNYTSAEREEATKIAWVRIESYILLLFLAAIRRHHCAYYHFKKLQAALIIGFLCFVCDFGGMFFGTSLFYNTVCTSHTRFLGDF
jgi:DMSO reductase anchor subunit